MTAKIAVTGSNGMTGRHLLRLLEIESIPYLAVSRSQWDITYWKTALELDVLFKGCDAVFHFAAQLPTESIFSSDQAGLQPIFDANVRSCLNLASWAKLRDIPLIFLSGSTVYENTNALNIKENSPKTANGLGGFYGYSKLLAEMVLDHYIADGLKTVVLRPSSIYGIGLPSSKLISEYLGLASTGDLLAVEGPRNKINLIHAFDVARASFEAFKSSSWGTYNVAGAEHSILEIAETAVNVCKSGSILVVNDDHIQPISTRFDLDISKAKAEFGYSPQVSLTQGMSLMLASKEI